MVKQFRFGQKRGDDLHRFAFDPESTNNVFGQVFWLVPIFIVFPTRKSVTFI